MAIPCSIVGQCTRAIYKMQDSDYIRLNSEKSTFLAPILDPTKKQRARFALRFIGKNKIVLDVGCADGEMGGIIRNAGNYVIGLDIQKEYLEKAKNIYDELILSNATKLPFEENAFDAVFAGEFIEHLNEEDFDKFLTEVKKILKKGGKFILTTPNPNSLRMKLMGKTKRDQEVGPHLKVYSTKDIKDKLNGFGFKTKKIVGLGKVGLLISTRIPIINLYGDYGLVSINIK